MQKKVKAVISAVFGSILVMSAQTNITAEEQSAPVRIVEYDGAENGLDAESMMLDLEINTVYGGDKTTAEALRKNYNNGSWEVTWSSKFKYTEDITFYSNLNCGYDKGLFTSYDTIQIVDAQPKGVYVQACVQNGNGGAFTNVIGETAPSTVAKKKHSGDDVTFSIVFGRD